MWGGSQFLTFVPFHGRWFTLLYISLFTIRSLVSKIHHAFFLITLLWILIPSNILTYWLSSPFTLVNIHTKYSSPYLSPLPNKILFIQIQY